MVYIIYYASSVTQTLRKSEFSISRHLDDYLKKETLKPENGGSESHLHNKQTHQLIKHISEQTYTHIRQIVAYISVCWNVKYTLSGLKKWLHQQGFTYKKLKKVPHKFNSDKQVEFVEYDKGLKAALAKDGVLLFMGATHPTQTTKITSGWIRKGVDTAINTTESRTRLGID
ncbi:MAG: winged helix-turn-helix domain-containing protein [Endozoicomonadaceae bacterium]|nr:winged helix-turn-helix domain-containing protein [Endozoicomonadaceae bacterium]